MKFKAVEAPLLPAFALLGAAAAAWSWWLVGCVALLALWLARAAPEVEIGHRCTLPRCAKCDALITQLVDVRCWRCAKG